MEITITTPALLFPAISLLLLAYTNRFLTISNLIRTLHAKYKTDPAEQYLNQIKNLRIRVHLIKNMQLLGISSLLLSVICMLSLFMGWIIAGKWLLAISLTLLAVSLGFTIREVQISGHALEIQLSDMDQ
ncbi:DUF2721 domain-containing protein [bacterium]|nr:MAG: DUF2721 domain-containing protein [bacterium]